MKQEILRTKRPLRTGVGDLERCSVEICRVQGRILRPSNTPVEIPHYRTPSKANVAYVMSQAGVNCTAAGEHGDSRTMSGTLSGPIRRSSLLWDVECERALMERIGRVRSRESGDDLVEMSHPGDRSAETLSAKRYFSKNAHRLSTS